MSLMTLRYHLFQAAELTKEVTHHLELAKGNTHKLSPNYEANSPEDEPALAMQRLEELSREMLNQRMLIESILNLIKTQQ